MDNEKTTIESIAEEISQLRDLFSRRLYEDKVKNKLYETILNQNSLLNRQLEEKQMESLFKEMLLICDRIEAQNDRTNFLDSILDEIWEVFARRGVNPTDICVEISSAFDPQYQNAVGTVPATEKFPHGTVVSVKRRGYMIGERVFRPADVIVAVEGHSN